MGTNKYKDHLLILLEDDANRQIANGFLQNLNLDQRAIQTLSLSRGWENVLSDFTKKHLLGIRKYPKRRILLLIDFDEQYSDRLQQIRKCIPEDVAKRVFVLGAHKEPEDLKKSINKSYEQIGEALAQDCFDGTEETWGHELLQHNKPELERMATSVQPFLF